MEGVVPSPPWVSRTPRLRVPDLGPYSNEPSIDFYDFPRRHGIKLTDNPSRLRDSFHDTRALASFCQSWLFFGLLSAFLRQPMRRVDFVRDGFVELDQERVHEHFRAWRRKLENESYSNRQRTRKSAEALIGHTLAESDVLEQVADLVVTRRDRYPWRYPS